MQGKDIKIDSGEDNKWCLKPFCKSCWGQDSHIFSKYHPIGYLLNTKGKKCHCNAEMGQTFPKPSDQNIIRNWTNWSFVTYYVIYVIPREIHNFTNVVFLPKNTKPEETIRHIQIVDCPTWQLPWTLQKISMTWKKKKGESGIWWRGWKENSSKLKTTKRHNK